MKDERPGRPDEPRTGDEDRDLPGEFLAGDGALGERVFDLGERTARFGESVIALVGRVPQTAVTRPLISQLVRSGTSVGANYMEAGAAQSGRDFDHKVGICKKEARETLHWLRMLAAAHREVETDSRELWREAHELVMIFSAILKKRRGA